jgi:hypothetical protein
VSTGRGGRGATYLDGHLFSGVILKAVEPSSRDEFLDGPSLGRLCAPSVMHCDPDVLEMKRELPPSHGIRLRKPFKVTLVDTWASVAIDHLHDDGNYRSGFVASSRCGIDVYSVKCRYEILVFSSSSSFGVYLQHTSNRRPNTLVETLERLEPPADIDAITSRIGEEGPAGLCRMKSEQTKVRTIRHMR